MGKKTEEQKECEKLLAEKMCEMWTIYKRYNPKGNYLSAFITNGCLMAVMNNYTEEDDKNPIDYFAHLAEEVRGEENIENHTI